MSRPERIVFPERPSRRLEATDFRLETAHSPRLAAGEVRVASKLLAIDPGVVLRLTGRAPFAPPYRLGDVVSGTGLGVVEESRHAGFKTGETVTGPLGWQSVAQLDGAHLEKWGYPDLPEEIALTALGAPGLTADFAIQLGRVRPNESVLISSAAGSVGMFAAQIARLKGARVVGIAGGPEKCAWLQRELNLDGSVDYKSAGDLQAKLGRACPDGVDMYLDLVGGDTLNAAVAVANNGARIVLCGALSEFDAKPGAHHGLRHLTWVITKNIRLEGFVLQRFSASFDDAREELAGWFRSGRLKSKAQTFDGLSAAPRALLGLLRGESFGRSLIRIA